MVDKNGTSLLIEKIMRWYYTIIILLKEKNIHATRLILRQGVFDVCGCDSWLEELEETFNSLWFP